MPTEKLWNESVLFLGAAQWIKRSRRAWALCPLRPSATALGQVTHFACFVIPIDSAGAPGQTCNPERSLHKQALRTQKNSQAPVQVVSLAFVSFLPSVSSHITVLHCCKMTHGSTFFFFFYAHWPVFSSLPTAFHLSTTPGRLVHPDGSDPADETVYLVLLWAEYGTPGKYCKSLWCPGLNL